MSVPSPGEGFSAPTLGTCIGRWLPMVTTCANPPCGARLRYLSEGRLFRLDVEYGKHEYFWLCADCASKVVLTVKAGHGVVVVPRAISDSSGVGPTSLHHQNAPAASSPTTNVFFAIDCRNRSCRERIFLARAGERYSSEKPELPCSFKIVCPKCGERQTVRRAGTYVIEVENSTAVTFADIL